MWSPVISNRLKYNSSVTSELKSCSGILESRLILIGLHGIGAAFLQTNFPKKSLIGTFALPEISMKNNLLGSLENDSNCLIYILEEDPSIVLVICNYQVSAERAFDWNNSLFQHLQAERVLVFDSLLDSKYIPNEAFEVRPPFLRQLVTRIQRKHQESQNKEPCPYLEAPNLIEKVPAAIIQYCERRNLDASVFLSWEDSRLLEVATLEAFETILHYYGVNSQVPSSASKYKQLVERIGRSNPLFL